MDTLDGVDEGSAADKDAGWRHYAKALGPGLITGASDDDPSGIATYAQSGAQFQYGLVWAALVTWPLMSAVQEVCDRTALSTGKGLGELIRARFGPLARRALIGVLIALLMLANALNMAADLVAIGQGMHLLHAGPATVWAVIGGIAITALVVSGSFETIAKVFKILCLSLVSYLIVLAVTHVDWGAVVRNLLIPHITWSAAYFGLLIGVLGTTISPYLFFWQSANRIEELRAEPEGGEKAVTLDERSTRAGPSQGQDEPARRPVRHDAVEPRDVRDHRRHRRHARCRRRTEDLVRRGRGEGARADRGKPRKRRVRARLRRLRLPRGSGACGVGIVGNGRAAEQAAGASRAALARRRCSTASSSLRRSAATFLSLLHVNPIALLVVVAVINGVLAAPFVAIVMLIADDERIMGDRRNGRLARTLGWLTFALMGAAAIALFAIQL